MHQDYATALVAQLESGQSPATAFTNLKKLLERRHHSKLLPGILRSALRTLAAGRTGATPTVVVADGHTQERQRAEITAALAELAATVEPAVTVDPTLIGGFIATHNYRERDHSFKRALINLYTSITT